jgi:hypothetical protein
VQSTNLRFITWLVLFASAVSLSVSSQEKTKATAKLNSTADAEDIMQKAPPRAEGEGPFPHLIPARRPLGLSTSSSKRIESQKL